MELGESDTRAKLIDPALHAHGWTEDPIRREETAGAIEIIDGKPRKRAKGRADYTLRVKVNPATQPVVVGLIEAKAEDFSPTHGREQAKLYASCKRLAAILKEQIAAVERARAAAEAPLEAAKALPAAYLHAVFNSPQAQQWPRKPLRKAFQLERGKFSPRPRNDPATTAARILGFNLVRSNPLTSTSQPIEIHLTNLVSL